MLSMDVKKYCRAVEAAERRDEFIQDMLRAQFHLRQFSLMFDNAAL